MLAGLRSVSFAWRKEMTTNTVCRVLDFRGGKKMCREDEENWSQRETTMTMVAACRLA